MIADQGAENRGPAGATAETAPFGRGRVWRFRGAPLPSSRVVIGRVDAPARDVAAPIVSVALVDVMLPGLDGIPTCQTVDHVPVTADAIADSLIEPLGVEDLPGRFDEGYGLWRADFEKGDAGVYDMPVDRIVSAISDLLAKAGRKPAVE